MKPLVHFRVIGLEACPWSVPRVTRSGGTYRPKKSKLHAGVANLDDWQTQVRLAAEAAMDGRPCVTGPVQIHYLFVARTPLGARDGDLWSCRSAWDAAKGKGKGAWCKVSQRGRSDEPDLTNLVKGTEDAMEGVVFGNDVQTRSFAAAATYGPLAGVSISVLEYEASDRPGIPDKIPEKAP